jgi:predicted double-glycine peptidase
MRGLVAFIVVVILVASPTAFAQPTGPVRSIVEQRQNKVILQKFDLSCGAAALATILRYQHGEPVTERDVALGLIHRAEYLAHPELVRLQQGFSLLDMKTFAERRGYLGEGFANLDYADLLQQAPAIVPLRLHGYNHFVLLADPAYGNRTMSLGRFMASWINYAKLGRIAFVVQRRDGLIPPNQLSVTPEDFLTLH